MDKINKNNFISTKLNLLKIILSLRLVRHKLMIWCRKVKVILKMEGKYESKKTVFGIGIGNYL